MQKHSRARSVRVESYNCPNITIVCLLITKEMGTLTCRSEGVGDTVFLTRVSYPAELMPLSGSGIEGIDLLYRASRRHDRHGNQMGCLSKAYL
jgi:hypothetical protein